MLIDASLEAVLLLDIFGPTMLLLAHFGPEENQQQQRL